MTIILNFSNIDIQYNLTFINSFSPKNFDFSNRSTNFALSFCYSKDIFFYKKITQINFIGEDKIGIEEKTESNTNIGPEPVLIHNIHLDKPEKYLYNQNIRFYKFMRIINAKSYEERDEIAKGDDLLMELNNWVKDYCHEGEEKFFNDLYWQERIQRCEGHKEGRKKSTVEIAKKMLKENSKPDFISRTTGLSLTEIKNLKEEITTNK